VSPKNVKWSAIFKDFTVFFKRNGLVAYWSRVESGYKHRKYIRCS